MKRYITPLALVLMITVATSAVAAGLFEPGNTHTDDSSASDPSRREGELDISPEGEDAVDPPISRTYTAKVIGIVRLVGNEPFTHLVITTEDGVDYILDEESRKQYHDLQGSHVIAHGEVRESPVYAGRTTFIGTQRVLTVYVLKSSS